MLGNLGFYNHLTLATYDGGKPGNWFAFLLLMTVNFVTH